MNQFEEWEEMVPDVQVISVIHDNETDDLRIDYDEEVISPFEAIGILCVALLRETINLSVDTELIDGEDDE